MMNVDVYPSDSFTFHLHSKLTSNDAETGTGHCEGNLDAETINICLSMTKYKGCPIKKQRSMSDLGAVHKNRFHNCINIIQTT